MWVKCNASECEHNRDGYCHLHCVYIEDGKCSNYKDYFVNNPLYQDVYFKRCRTLMDGKPLEYRAQSKGMRYEWKGFVLYTEDDIRNTIDNASFTEEITGLLMSGGAMRTREGFDEVVREVIKKNRPVLEYPWYEIDKRTKKLVPHDMTEELSPKGLHGDNAW